MRSSCCIDLMYSIYWVGSECHFSYHICCRSPRNLHHPSKPPMLFMFGRGRIPPMNENKLVCRVCIRFQYHFLSLYPVMRIKISSNKHIQSHTAHTAIVHCNIFCQRPWGASRRWCPPPLQRQRDLCVEGICGTPKGNQLRADAPLKKETLHTDESLLGSSDVTTKWSSGYDTQVLHSFRFIRTSSFRFSLPGSIIRNWCFLCLFVFQMVKMNSWKAARLKAFLVVCCEMTRPAAASAACHSTCLFSSLEFCLFKMR